MGRTRNGGTIRVLMVLVIVGLVGMVANVSAQFVSDTNVSTYISYGALIANSVPCSNAGASYYCCAASGPANPYTRSCTFITACARITE